jgi:hypothetical protein
MHVALLRMYGCVLFSVEKEVYSSPFFSQKQRFPDEFLPEEKFVTVKKFFHLIVFAKLQYDKSLPTICNGLNFLLPHLLSEANRGKKVT